MSADDQPALELLAGHRYELDDGRIGIIQYKGLTAFAPGEWIGMTLEKGSGNNDGSVYKKRYFMCREGRGLFIRRSKIAKYLGSSKRRAPQSEEKATESKDEETEKFGVELAVPTEIRDASARNQGFKDQRMGSYALSLENVEETISAPMALVAGLESSDAPETLSTTPMSEILTDDSLDDEEKKQKEKEEYEITPDHSSYLEPKFITNETILNAHAGETASPKPGPTDIGRNDDFESPQYDIPETSDDFLAERGRYRANTGENMDSWVERQGQFEPREPSKLVVVDKKLGPRDIGRNDFSSPHYNLEEDERGFLAERVPRSSKKQESVPRKLGPRDMK